MIIMKINSNYFLHYTYSCHGIMQIDEEIILMKYS